MPKLPDSSNLLKTLLRNCHYLPLLLSPGCIFQYKFTIKHPFLWQKILKFRTRCHGNADWQQVRLFIMYAPHMLLYLALHLMVPALLSWKPALNVWPRSGPSSPLLPGNMSSCTLIHVPSVQWQCAHEASSPWPRQSPVRHILVDVTFQVFEPQLASSSSFKVMYWIRISHSHLKLIYLNPKNRESSAV